MQKLALQASGANAVTLGSMGMAPGMIPGMPSGLLPGMLPGLGVINEVPTKVVCLSQVSSSVFVRGHCLSIWFPDLDQEKPGFYPFNSPSVMQIYGYLLNVLRCAGCFS